MKHYLSFSLLLMSMLFCFACSSDSNNNNDVKLDGIWVHSSRSVKYKYDYVFVFKEGKVFEEELWEYSNKNDFMNKYNSPNNWTDYTFSNGILRVGSFSSAIKFSGNSFTYRDGDGDEQTFSRFDGTIESFVESAMSK